MWIITENKMETIEVPVSYKNVFVKIIENFSASELEKKVFLEEDYLFFSEKQERELVWLNSYKNLKNTINDKFWWK